MYSKSVRDGASIFSCRGFAGEEEFGGGARGVGRGKRFIHVLGMTSTLVNHLPNIGECQSDWTFFFFFFFSSCS